MILRGSIQRFDLTSVLQFLAQNTATGILEIRDSEEHGHIYLVNGRLEAISLPVTNDRLGVFLMKNGLISAPHLANVLMEEAAGLDNGEVRKPLGQRLVEKGFISDSVVRQAMHRMTVARMFEIAHWRSGEFNYEEPERMPEFKIAIRCDVQELLLKTQVLIDHGQKPRKQLATRQQADLCHGCTVTDCSPGIKAKYLKKDLCLWRKMSSPAEPNPDSRGELRGESRLDIYAEEARVEAAMRGQWGQF